MGIPRGLISRALVETFRREGVSGGELSVTFVSDAEMTRLHGRHLGLAEVTDVLAFALHGDGEEPLGDVYIGHAQALRQAEENGVGPHEEMARLAVHGTLHILGYEHPEGPERDACEMFRVQEEVMSRLGGPDREAVGASERVVIRGVTTGGELP